MKIHCLILYILIFPILSYSQELLEDNPNWSKYSKVIEVNPEFKDSKNVYILEGGKVIKTQNFIKDSLVYSETYIYDKHNNVEMIIKDLRNDTIKLDNQYTFGDLLEYDKDFYYSYNKNGKLVSKWKEGFLPSISYSYNETELIDQIVSIELTSHGFLQRTTSFLKYNKCNNVIESKSVIEKIQSISQKNEPDLDNTKISQYTYKYNNRDCIWTKKYLVENGKKKLISTRKLIKPK